MRQHIFEFINGSSHISRQSVTQLLKLKFLCIILLKMPSIGPEPVFHVKLVQHINSVVGIFHQPQRCFDHIHVEVMGTLPTSQGHYYSSIVIDRSTLWAEAILIQGVTSVSSAAAILSGWIARFSIPELITPNKSATSTSQLWTSLGHLLGIIQHQTTTYNPAAK
ncbi:uncharacterized protein [Palaemon carinicauda]|uniref:uncharacterized protein n=1 Tax=Palaemon carinicauda TaxID=392227 RepID=UPI0035B6372D